MRTLIITLAFLISSGLSCLGGVYYSKLTPNTNPCLQRGLHGMYVDPTGKFCVDPYSNENIHQAATRVISASYPALDRGSYDICDSIRNELPEMGTNPPVFDLVNACAIILDGAEW